MKNADLDGFMTMRHMLMVRWIGRQRLICGISKEGTASSSPLIGLVTIGGVGVRAVYLVEEIVHIVWRRIDDERQIAIG